MAKVTVERRQEIHSTDAARAGKRDLLITYRDEKGVVGLVLVPSETASESTIREAIRKDLATRATLEGKTFDISP